MADGAGDIPRKTRPQTARPLSRDYAFIKKVPPKSYADLEKDLWKNNITFTPRQHKDILDISNEDFSKINTLDLQGERGNPSNFNIFRDSLAKTSKQLHERLVAALPDMNLDDITSNSSSSASEAEQNDVVPLDFRTAWVKRD